MKFPDIQYRRLAYKLVLALIPAIGALVPAGILTAGTAGLIAGVLGFLGNLLADRASSHLEKDGTLILSGSVEEQVNKGIDILASEAAKSIENLNQVGINLDRLNQAKNDVIQQAQSIPVLGPLAQEALGRLKF